MSSTPWATSEEAQLVSELVRRPSFQANEAGVAEFMAQWLETAGCRVSLQEVEPGRKNVIASLGDVSRGPTLMFWGHTDTVAPVEGWSTDPLDPVIRGNRLYGLGAEDMKGGLAALMLAMRRLAPYAQALKGRLLFVGVADEEAYSKGVLAFLAALPEYGPVHMSILAEPHFDAALLGAVGKLLVRIDVKGKAAHGSTPELGINAIDEAGKLLVALSQLPMGQHEKLGRGNQCVLSIEGGYKQYMITVPETCSITLNRHTVPGETRETVLAQIRQVVESLNSKAQFTTSVLPPYYPPFITDENHALVKIFSRVHEEVLGSAPRFDYGRGVCDANYAVTDYGIPTVMFGPSGGNLHSSDEWVDLSRVRLASQLYERMAQRILMDGDVIVD